MKRKLKRSLFLSILIVGVGTWGVFLANSPTLFAQAQEGEGRNITITHEDESQSMITVQSNENVTIAILKETLKGYTDEQIDDYFAYFESDDQRILADEFGGIMSKVPGYEGDGDLGYVINNDGTTIHYNLFSPEATTVGEAKVALKLAND